MLISRTFGAGLLVLIPYALALGDATKDLTSVLKGVKNLSTFRDLVKKYPEAVLDSLGINGVTIIAPSDKAFKNIPYTPLNNVWNPEDKEKTKALLQYHVLKGTVMIGSLEPGPTYVQPTLLTNARYSNVTAGQNVLLNKQRDDDVVLTTGLGTRSALVKHDIMFKGGVVHVIDNLLIPPARLDETAEAFQIPSFLGGLYAADLMPDLANRKNVTIFAPQDAALEAVGGTLEGMDPKEIARILSYHVVPGQILASASLVNGSSFETLARNGDAPSSVLIRQAGNNKYVNSAQIVQPDILIANGILHLISNVLNPDAGAASPVPEVATQSPVFPVSSVVDPFTSAIPCSDCPDTSVAPSETPVSDSDDSGDSTTHTTTDLSTETNDGAAAPARCTAHVAGAAIGMVGIGAGLAWL